MYLEFFQYVVYVVLVAAAVVTNYIASHMHILYMQH